MEDIYGVVNTVTEFTIAGEHAGQPPSYILAPFVCQTILEAPYVLSEEIKAVPLACRRSDQDLGFAVYLSIDGGVSYSLIDKVANLQPYGTLVDSYSKNTYTIDDEVGFEINFVAGADLRETVTWPVVFSGDKNLAILGDELISFRSIAPVSSDIYKLTDIIRGRYGTQKKSHAIGEAFYFVSKNVALVNHSEIAPGVTRKFKFVPYNIKFTGDISESVPLDLTIEGESKKPHIPVNFFANGSNFAARYSTDSVLTWDVRYRGKGAGVGIPGIVLADSDREGYFEVEVWVSGSKVRTVSSIDALTWIYSEAMNIVDNGSLPNEVLFKLSNYRTEDGITFASNQVEVLCKKY